MTLTSKPKCGRKGLMMEYRKMTPRELFEILAQLTEENGVDAVKNTVDSMWDFLRRIEDGDEW